MPNLLTVCHLQHLLGQRRQHYVFRPFPRWDEVVNVPVLCHPFSLLLKYQYSLLLAPLLHSHDLRDTCCLEESFLRYRFQIQLVPAFLDEVALLTRDGLGYTSGAAIEWPGPCTRTVCAHPRPPVLYLPHPCPPPHPQLQPPN